MRWVKFYQFRTTGIRALCTLAVFFFLKTTLLAQSGNFTGTVIDPNGFALPGASIQIEPSKRTTFTDFDGNFSILKINVGEITVRINYLGFTEYEAVITIKNDLTTDLLFTLVPQYIELDEVDVYEQYTNGQLRALNIQKNSISLKNIISMDQLGKFPDANIGDAVKRTAGINIQVDQGEARDVIIRGLSPELNAVSINGSRIPSAEGDNRNVQMDLIPSDMIQTVEINKALTPDNDADALGGAINLITRTSPEGFRLSSTMGTGINFITNTRILNGSLVVGDRSKGDRFGWMLAASFYDTEFGSDNVEAEWKNNFEYNTGITDAEGLPVLETLNVNPYPFILEQQTHVIQRIRRSLSFNMDFKINDRNSLYLKSMYNWRDDRENRANLEYEVLPGEDIGEDDFSIAGNSLTRFPTEVSRQLRGGAANRSKTARLEDQRMQNYTLGGKHFAGSSKIDWLASYSKASEDSEKERIGEFKSEYIVRNDISSSRYPFFAAENEADFNDLNAFLFDEITEENLFNEEDDINILANIEFPSKLDSSLEGIFKTGFRGRFKGKLRDNDFLVFDLSDQFPSLTQLPTVDYSDPDFLAGSRYQIGLFPTADWLSDLVLESGDLVPSEFLGQNYEVEENVYAAYFQLRQELSKQWEILTGIRTEHTRTKATANQIIDEETSAGMITEEADYTNIMPGIHLKYSPSTSSVWRFSWSNTLARPNYVDLVPTLDIVFEDREIFSGNPDLQAVRSMNFDLAYENYFKSVGIISAGVFFKKIRDFIYTFKGTAEDDSFGPGTQNFDLFQPLNGDSSSLIGFEFAFSKKFDQSSGIFNNFILDANYTFLNSSAKGIRNEAGIERENLDLPRTSPHSFNLSVGYEKNRFQARLSANFSDSYLDEIGRNEFEDIYYDQQFFLDFNASILLHRNWSVYAALNNITNRPLRLYQGSQSLTSQVEFYGRRLTFGLKFDLFKKQNDK